MNRASNISIQLILGVFAILFGVVFLLDNFGWVEARFIIRMWPVIFIVIGVVKIARTRSVPAYFVGGVFILIGTLMITHRLGWIFFSWRDWWPLVLIIAGVAFIIKAVNRTPHNTGAITGDSGVMDLSAVLSGQKYKSDGREFAGGEVTSVMGGCEIDLRQAQLTGDASMEVFVFWGGIDIKVPGDWAVVMNGMAILGGINDDTAPTPGTNKRLVIKGLVIMGGVQIGN